MSCSLHKAVFEGDFGKVTKLLKQGGEDLGAKDKHGSLNVSFLPILGAVFEHNYYLLFSNVFQVTQRFTSEFCSDGKVIIRVTGRCLGIFDSCKH